MSQFCQRYNLQPGDQFKFRPDDVVTYTVTTVIPSGYNPLDRVMVYYRRLGQRNEMLLAQGEPVFITTNQPKERE